MTVFQPHRTDPPTAPPSGSVQTGARVLVVDWTLYQKLADGVLPPILKPQRPAHRPAQCASVARVE